MECDAQGNQNGQKTKLGLFLVKNFAVNLKNSNFVEYIRKAVIHH